MRLKLGEDRLGLGIVGREDGRGGALDTALNSEALLDRRDVHLEAHERILRLLAGVNVRRVGLNAKFARAHTAQSRYVAGQREFDGIDDAALTGAIGP